MRASVKPRQGDRKVISVPVKMGGMGVLSHRECSNMRERQNESGLVAEESAGRGNGGWRDRQGQERGSQGERWKEVPLARGTN